MIPDYDVVVIDEAHELSSRVTQAATDELLRRRRRPRRPPLPALRRSTTRLPRPTTSPTPATPWRARSPSAGPGRFDDVPEQLADALVLVRDAARACLSAYPKEGDDGRRRRRPHPGQGSVQEVFATAERMAADARVRRALADRGRRPDPAAAVRRAAPGVGPDARQAAHRQDRGDHLGDPDARRRLQRGRHLGRAQADRAGRSTAATVAAPDRRARRAAVARPRRRLAVRLRPAGDPLRRPPPAAARPRRPRRRPSSTRSPTLVDAAEGRTLGLFSLAPRGRDRGRGGPRAAAPPDHAGPGRRPAARAGAAVRRATRTPACSARSACGRASTSRARPASWCSSTGSRSRGPTTR